MSNGQPPRKPNLPTFGEKVRIKIPGEERDEWDPMAYIRIDRSDLAGELVDQHEYYVFWGWIASEFEARAARLELDGKTLKADIDRAIREAALEAGEKVTEARIKELIRNEPAYKELQKELIEANKMANYTKTISIGFFKRFDALQTLVKKEQGENFNASQMGTMNPNLNMYAQNTNKENKQ